MPDMSKLLFRSKLFNNADKALYAAHPKVTGIFYKKDKIDAVQRLIEESKSSGDYYFMLLISTIIACVGLLLDSGSVVIGAMLITPLLTPLLALGLGIVTGNGHSILRSSWSVTLSVSIVLLVSFGLGRFFGFDGKTNNEILQRVTISAQYLIVAFFSGLAATYAWIKPKANASLPGAAVSVALLPPLCVMGLGMAVFDRQIMSGAANLFLFNLSGIILSSTMVFSLFGFKSLRKVEDREIATEEKEKAKGGDYIPAL